MRSLSNIITMALAAAATAPGCWAQDAPNQQCLDDAGPPWADVPVYYENRDIPTFDRPLLPDDGQCPEPLAEACATKSTKAAYLEGPISCPAGKGWFCRIAFQDGWSRETGQPGEGYLTDSNFMHCNQTSEDGGGDGDGHCHGSDADSTYGWWVRDHWNRGYAGTLNCCCGWSDLQELAIVNRCDYRHTVYDDNTDPKYRPDSCRDANEEHGMGFDLRGDGDTAGCPAAGNPTFRDPLDTSSGQCWSVQNFGYNENPPGTLPPTRPATPTPPPSPSAPSAPTPPPPTSRPNAPPSSPPPPPPPPCSSDTSDASWRDAALNGCDASQITAAWCRNNGDEMFEQADGSMMSGNQACTQCGACNTAPTTRPPTTRPVVPTSPPSPSSPAPTTASPTTPAPTTPAPTAAPGECTNSRYFCTTWASLGYCVASLEYDDFMHRECPVACHTCPGNEHPMPPRNTGPATTSSTTVRPATPAPTTASPTDDSVPCHFTSCGRSGVCSEPASCATHEERHEVRCCSDTTRVPAWSQTSSACPWTESNNFNSENAACLSDRSYDEAAGFCASVGARLCTVAEAEADCLRGTGCGHDVDLIWTSDAGRTSAAMGRLAMAMDAGAAPLRPTTSTAEPDATMGLAASTGNDAAGSSTAAVVGAVVGAVVVVALVVGVFAMHHKSAGRPSKETEPATVEEGLSLRLKSVRRGNPAFVTSVVVAETAGTTGI